MQCKCVGSCRRPVVGSTADEERYGFNHPSLSQNHAHDADTDPETKGSPRKT